MQFKVSRYPPTLAYVKVVLTINSETAIHGVVILERCVTEAGKNKDSRKFNRRQKKREERRRSRNLFYKSYNFIYRCKIKVAILRVSWTIWLKWWLAEKSHIVANITKTKKLVVKMTSSRLIIINYRKVVDSKFASKFCVVFNNKKLRDKKFFRSLICSLIFHVCIRFIYI